MAALGLRAGSEVLDVGCGTGDFLRELAHRGARPVGVDMSLGMLAAAGAGVSVVQGDALLLPFPDRRFDAVSCGFVLRNVTSPRTLVEELARVLRPGGALALLEVAEPEWGPARWVHRRYFHHVVPLIGGLLSDRDAYRYLPASTVHLPDATTLAGLLAAAGFGGIERRLLGGGAAQLFTGRRLG